MDDLYLEQLDPFMLPAVALDDMHRLPRAAGGIYFVLCCRAILYIGETDNFYDRWNRQEHHHLFECCQLPGVRIAWKELNYSAWMRKQVESFLIRKFHPILKMKWNRNFERMSLMGAIDYFQSFILWQIEYAVADPLPIDYNEWLYCFELRESERTAFFRCDAIGDEHFQQTLATAVTESWMLSTIVVGAMLERNRSQGVVFTHGTMNPTRVFLLDEIDLDGPHLYDGKLTKIREAVVFTPHQPQAGTDVLPDDFYNKMTSPSDVLRAALLGTPAN